MGLKRQLPSIMNHKGSSELSTLVSQTVVTADRHGRDLPVERRLSSWHLID